MQVGMLQAAELLTGRAVPAGIVSLAVCAAKITCKGQGQRQFAGSRGPRKKQGMRHLARQSRLDEVRLDVALSYDIFE